MYVTHLDVLDNCFIPSSSSVSERKLRSSEPKADVRSRFQVHKDFTLLVALAKVAALVGVRLIGGQFVSFHLTQFLSRDKTVSTTLANAGPSGASFSAIMIALLVCVAHSTCMVLSCSREQRLTLTSCSERLKGYALNADPSATGRVAFSWAERRKSTRMRA
jgi:hypothetical protein